MEKWEASKVKDKEQVFTKRNCHEWQETLLCHNLKIVIKWVQSQTYLNYDEREQFIQYIAILA